MRTNIKKLIFSAMFASLICVATLVIQIPLPLGGYINLGDALILMCTAFLSPVYAFFTSAIGSALADVFSGYVMYAPATFVIKGFTALVSCGIFGLISHCLKDSLSRIISFALAECAMVLGYFIFEGFIYGFGASLISIPANSVQGAVGVILGVLLVNIFGRIIIKK